MRRRTTNTHTNHITSAHRWHRSKREKWWLGVRHERLCVYCTHANKYPEKSHRRCDKVHVQRTLISLCSDIEQHSKWSGRIARGVLDSHTQCVWQFYGASIYSRLQHYYSNRSGWASAYRAYTHSHTHTPHMTMGWLYEPICAHVVFVHLFVFCRFIYYYFFRFSLLLIVSFCFMCVHVHPLLLDLFFFFSFFTSLFSGCYSSRTHTHPYTLETHRLQSWQRQYARV